MKQGTTELVKFKKLKRRLGITKDREAIGILESLWALARREAPCGDIGRLDNETIAIELEWDDDPDQLVDALIETTWLDACAEHRVIVHDWRDHAPRYIQGIAARKGGIIVSPTVVHDSSSEQLSSTPSLAKPIKAKPSVETSNEVCPADGDTPSAEPVSEPVTAFVFPVKLSEHWPHETWTLTESQLADYKRRFPSLVVEDAIQKALDWIHDSPGRKKTGGGMKKFLTIWLKGERGCRAGPSGNYSRSSRSPGNYRGATNGDNDF